MGKQIGITPHKWLVMVNNFQQQAACDGDLDGEFDGSVFHDGEFDGKVDGEVDGPSTCPSRRPSRQNKAYFHEISPGWWFQSL